MSALSLLATNPTPADFGKDPWWLVLIKVVAVFVFLVVMTLFAIWYERRVVARILRDEVERRVAHLVQAIEIRRRIQPRILDARHQERRRGQVRSRAIGGVGDLFRERLDHDDLSQRRAHPARRW